MKSSKIIIILSIALALLFAIVVFYNFATAGEAISEDKISWIKETPIAHRGLHTKDIPENSLSAFENALKNNYAIELDVQFTKDKEVVVFHDENLKRITNDTRNIEDVNYSMLPSDKYNYLEKLINNKKENTIVAFVGDGINDAPVLKLADLGISMGALGTDSAIEASDIVIMNDNLDKIITAINISKKTGKIINQNLIFAIGIKLLVLILTLLGVSTMLEAVFADVGVTVLCILNTLRLLKNNK